MNLVVTWQGRDRCLIIKLILLSQNKQKKNERNYAWVQFYLSIFIYFEQFSLIFLIAKSKKNQSYAFVIETKCPNILFRNASCLFFVTNGK